MATAAELTTLIRYKTHTNSSTFPDAELLAYMNSRMDELAQDILKVDEDILLIPQYTSLVANQREYSFPADMLAKIKRVEAKLNGTDWLKLDEIDITQHSYPITLEADITKYFTNEEGGAFFDIMRKALTIYSGTIPTVSNGLRMWVNTWITHITDLTGTTDLSIDPSTITHGIPRELHNIWTTGIVIDYKSSREKPIPLTEQELKYEFDKKTALDTIRNGNMDREIIAHLPGAESRGNDGFDY